MPDPRILVPLDFSDCSRLLVSEATVMAKRLGARLTLLHVVQPPQGLSPDTMVVVDPAVGTTGLQQALVDAAWQRLPEYVELASRYGVEVDAQVDVGHVVDRILAHEADHQMLVLGTHGRRGVARMLLGSVAEQVVRRARLPVLTIRTEHRPDCEARSCSWCASHLMPEDLKARVELDG